MNHRRQTWAGFTIPSLCCVSICTSLSASYQWHLWCTFFFFYFPTVLRSIDKGHIFSSIMYLKQNFTKDQLDLDELDPSILELWWQIIVTVKFGLRYKPSTWHLGYRDPSWSVVWLAKVTTKRIIEQDEIVEFVWIGKWTKLMTCCKHTYAHRVTMMVALSIHDKHICLPSGFSNEQKLGTLGFKR